MTLDFVFRQFEGRCHPLPLALFRIAFYGGVALHVLPSLYFFDENFGPSALRLRVWDAALYDLLPRLNPFYVRAAAWLLATTIISGLLGVLPRMSAAITGVLLYVFASFNGLNLHTLFLPMTWAITWLLAVCGSGNEVLSVSACRRSPSKPVDGSTMTRGLIALTLVVSVFFSGVEKLYAGWPTAGHLDNLFRYPAGSFLRDWAVGSAWSKEPRIAGFLSWATIGCELGLPVALLWKPTRLYGVIAYELFFLSILALVAVPPLAYCIYAGGGILMLDDRFFGQRHDSPSRVQSSSSRPRRP